MGNNSMRDQLQSAFNRQEHNRSDKGYHQSKKKQSKLQLPRASDWIADGEDHINLSYVGATDLGRTLHPTSMLSFVHEVFGRFNSVSAFWDYIETGARNDRLRTMPHGIRKEAKSAMPRVEVECLEFMVLDACWQRIKAYPVLMQALKDSELPFDLYRTVGELHIPVRVETSMWLVEGMELIRRALKKDQTPNFVRWTNLKSRQTVFEEYCARYIRNARPMTDANRENKLLKDLIQSGPMIPQPKRKVQINRDASQVSQQAASKEEVLETLVKVDVTELESQLTQGHQDVTVETTEQPEKALEVVVNEESVVVTENTST